MYAKSHIPMNIIAIYHGNKPFVDSSINNLPYIVRYWRMQAKFYGIWINDYEIVSNLVYYNLNINNQATRNYNEELFIWLW